MSEKAKDPAMTTIKLSHVQMKIVAELEDAEGNTINLIPSGDLPIYHPILVNIEAKVQEFLKGLGEQLPEATVRPPALR